MEHITPPISPAIPPKRPRTNSTSVESNASVPTTNASNNVSSLADLESLPPSSLITKTQSYFVTLSAGLEFLAEAEIRELINPSIIKRSDNQGKLFFATDKKVEELVKLRSVDALYAFVAEVNGVPSDETAREHLISLPSKLDWEPALHTWRTSQPFLQPFNAIHGTGNTPLQSPIERHANDNNAKPDESPQESGMDIDPSPSEQKKNAIHTSTSTFPTLAQQIALDPTPPSEITFRVTGKRTGDHKYKSPEVAGWVGAGLIKKYGWKVDLKKHDMEVLADLVGDNIVLGICLVPYLFNRHRAHLGQTSLKPSIAYCMARLGNIQPGYCVLDPMMGIGTIPIEAAQVWKGACYIGGDISREAVEKAANNMKSANVHTLDLYQWSVYKLPLTSGSIDVVISDIPFGRRSGSFKKNQKLYPRLFREITRVIKYHGKAIILTLEKGLMKMVLHGNVFWKCSQIYPVDCGGLHVGLYVLERTDVSLDHRKLQNENKA
mmetsp:Transcript_21614/g.30217  ORF Transcript_21614/g.30217 Transcript_21614/m.30217 type:complete len:493 (+) Transcript_21614:64-1542(+)